MDVISIITRVYEERRRFWRQKNKAKFKILPLKSAFVLFENSLLDKLTRIVDN